MTEAPADPPQPKHDPLAALRVRSFVAFITSRFVYGVASSLLQTVMLWQVYAISESALNLGLLGLARLLPALPMSLVGGAAADVYNRRNILMASQAVPLVCALVLTAATLGGWISLVVIYAIVVVLGLAAAFEGPARNALLPAIVPPQTFANAVNINSTVQSLSMVTGPVLGGTLIAVLGIGESYAVFTVLSAAAIVAMSFVSFRPAVGAPRALTLAMVREGIHFVRTRQVLLGSMLIDLFAVIFGGVKALLPIYAEDILQVGSTGFGVLVAMFDIGAFSMSFVLLMRPPVERTGRALILTCAAFGLGAIIFGLSRNFYLSCAVYLLIGAADQVSVVMRNTTLQLATPDELRGRVSAVSQLFIQSSNQINALESGVVASLTSATFAVVSGGFGTLAVVAAVKAAMPELWSYRIPRHEEKVIEPARGVAAAATPGPTTSDVRPASVEQA